MPYVPRTAPVNQFGLGLSFRAVFVAVLISVAIRPGFAIAQTANSNAGLEGGQDNLFDAILAASVANHCKHGGRSFVLDQNPVPRGPSIGEFRIVAAFGPLSTADVGPWTR